ncbi:PIG-L deacetylase family protein [Citricoccus sp. I39-566]|uniref:PIG-L deacetylase family protein n=1 Tax=Citricoccus sp. I39-566 TaxID=3073268 RepID=UPI00286A5690|nr:PIG-L deacetylase family protein [Citricoccus sp. I39-566]WMY77747.1 PIG-L deacetylase family protein [Citricoccus sp. I39-566]
MMPLTTPAELAAEHGWTTVLAFGAHPDDLDFGAAATVAGLTRAGVEVTYVVMTDGDAGGFEAENQHTMTERRHREQREAAAHLGVRDVEYLGERDGYLEPSHAVQAKVVEAMRRHRPDAVFTMSPERDWSRLQRSHPDHLAAGEAVVRASYPAVENPFAYPELAAGGLGAFHLKWLVVYCHPAERSNLAVDVTGFEQDKLAALRFHASQHPDVQRMETFVLDGMEQLHRDWTSAHRPEGTPDTVDAPNVPAAPRRFVETFQLVSVNDASTISGF